MFRSSIVKTSLLRSPRRFLSVGQSLPTVELRHTTPGDLFTIPSTGKQVVVGVPAAFSPGCSNSHIPGYLSQIAKFKEAGVEGIYVVSVNDVFVMNAWSTSFASESTRDVLHSGGEGEGYVKFLADHDGAWTRAAELEFDATKILGNPRSKRFAAIVQNGTVKSLFVESDGTGITVSKAEK